MEKIPVAHVEVERIREKPLAAIFSPPECGRQP